MYSREKIVAVMQEIYDESKTIKPYVVIAQPRRDLNETAAQNFDGYDGLHVDLMGFSHGFCNIGGEKVDVARNYLIEQALAVAAKVVVHLLDDAVGSRSDVSKTMHGAFGLTGRTRGVDDHCQIIRLARWVPRQAIGVGDDVIPFVKGIGWRQRKRDARKMRGHTRRLFVPFIELAHEQQAGFRMLQHKFHGVGLLGREDGDRGVTRHPYRQLGHEKMRAVF